MNTTNKLVISGEAPETDSEDEITDSKPPPINMSRSIQGAVIKGEDTESENENEGSISSAVSVLSQVSLSREGSRRNDGSSNTLLQQKLRESNAQLRNDIASFCDNILNEASKTLGSVDQHLLKSQIVLQGALSSVRSLSVNSLNVTSKLSNILSANFLSNVKIPPNE